MKTARTALLIAVLVFVIHGLFLLDCIPTGFFPIDDDSLVNIPQLRIGINHFGRFLSSISVPGNHIDFYPIRDLSYWIDIHLFGAQTTDGDGSVFRVLNLVLLSLSASFFYIILSRISAALAIPISLIWALHPVHWEEILWISARKDILATALTLGAVVAFQDGKKRDSNFLLGGSFFLFVMGLLSKQTYALLPLTGVILEKRPKQRLWLLLASAAGIAASFLQSWFYSNINDMRYFYPISYRELASADALGRMATGWITPWVNGISVENWGDWAFQQSLWAAIGVLLWTAWIAGLIGAIRSRDKTLLSYLVCIVLIYLPTSALLFPHRNFYSVRYFEPVTLPLFALLGTQAIHKIGSSTKAIFFGALIFLAASAFALKPHWQDPLSIVKRSSDLEPQNPSLRFLELVEMKNVARWGRMDQTELQEMHDLERNLEIECGSKKLNAPLLPSGDLCMSYWIYRYKTDPQLVDPNSTLMRRLELILQSLNPYRYGREKVRIAFRFEQKTGHFTRAVATEWLERHTYFPDPDLRFQRWLALCTSGKADAAQEVLRKYFESGLLDRDSFGAHYGALLNVRSETEISKILGQCLSPAKRT